MNFTSMAAVLWGNLHVSPLLPGPGPTFHDVLARFGEAFAVLWQWLPHWAHGLLALMVLAGIVNGFAAFLSKGKRPGTGAASVPATGIKSAEMR